MSRHNETTMTEMSDLSNSQHSSTPRRSLDNQDDIASMPGTPGPYPSYFNNGSSSVPLSAVNSVANFKSAAPSTTTGFALHSNEPKYFHSRRIQKGQVEKPWTERKDKKQVLVKWVPVVGIILGFCVAGVLIWDGMKSVTNSNYCPVYTDDFSSGTLNPNIWTKEVEVGGFG